MMRGRTVAAREAWRCLQQSLLGARRWAKSHARDRAPHIRALIAEARRYGHHARVADRDPQRTLWEAALDIPTDSR